MVELAEAEGELHEGDTILEPSSGNTGIGLAMVARLRGYKLRVVMPENVSVERRQLLEIFGAEITLSPADEGSNGAIRLSEKLGADEPSLVRLFQYGNPANPLAHYEGTGPEIWRDCPEVDVFVAGLGTSGTLMGVGRYLKEQKASVQVVAVEPPAGELVQGLRSLDDGFVPPIFDPGLLDRKFIVRAARVDRVAAPPARRLRRVRGCVLGRRGRGCREDGRDDGVGHDRHPVARRGLEVPVVGRVDRRHRRRGRARDAHQLLVVSMTVTRELISRAAAILREGGLVAFPTETVYGLGADASSPEALRRLYDVKGRPAGHPVIVHLADATALGEWAGVVPPAARRLADACWPGSLTLVLRRSKRVPDEVTGGLDTVGVRVPDQPVARALLGEFGGGVAAPSANRFGRVRARRPPPTSAPTSAPTSTSSSTVARAESVWSRRSSTARAPTSRSSAWARFHAERIEAVVGHPVAVRAPGEQGPRAPGTLPSHYAPRARVRLAEDATLAQVARDEIDRGAHVGVVASTIPRDLPSEAVMLGEPVDVDEYARALYRFLRDADERALDVVVAVPPPERGIGTAVADRLRRAAGERA